MEIICFFLTIPGIFVACILYVIFMGITDDSYKRKD